MKTKTLIFATILSISLIFIGIGCGPVEKTGTLQINLTDAPGDYSKVVICFTEISVHKSLADNETAEDNETEWFIISDKEQSFDLLTLQMSEGKFNLLGEADLTVGHYTQIRLKITDALDNESNPKTYIMLADDNETKYPLVVPSGTKSGLKLTSGFDITADNDTVIYLDFDAEESVKTPGDKYHLQPTIKILYDLVPIEE